MCNDDDGNVCRNCCLKELMHILVKALPEYRDYLNWRRKGNDNIVLPQSEQQYEPLTPAEREVLLLVAQGMLNKEIAKERGTKLYTVKGQVHNILNKLGAASRTEAVRIGRDLGLL